MQTQRKKHPNQRQLIEKMKNGPKILVVKEIAILVNILQLKNKN